MKEIVKEAAKHAAVAIVTAVAMYLTIINFNPLISINLAKLFPPLLFFTTLTFTASALSAISEITGEKAGRALKAASTFTNTAGTILLLKTFPYEEFHFTSLMAYIDDVVLVGIGLSVIDVSELFLDVTTPLFKSIGTLLVFYAVSEALIKTPVKPASTLSPAVFCAGLAYATLNLATLLTFSDNREVAELGRYIARRTGRYAFYVFLVAFYAISLRGILASYAPLLGKYMPFIEVGFATLLTGMVADGVYTHFNKEKIFLVHTANQWRLHRPYKTFFSEPWLEELDTSIENFITRGNAIDLSLRLTYVLARHGIPFKDIENVLKPLTSYSREEVPIIAFRWQKHRAYRRQAEERIYIVTSTIEKARKLVERRRAK